MTNRFSDDPLSAVDAHVGRHIFDKVIGPEGALKSKTRILVTHAINYLAQVDEIIVLKDGEIAERGTYQELRDAKGPFSEYLTQYLQENPEETENGADKEVQRQDSVKETPERRLSRSKSKTPLKEEKKDPKQYETEKMETGKVGWSVYTYYIANMGLCLFGGCIMGFLVYQVSSTGSSVWLSVWSDRETKFENNSTFNSTVSDRLDNLGIYGLFGLGQTIATVCASLLLYLSTLQGAKTLHNNMLKNILRSPLAFFDTTPQGRIINRFGKDVDVLDTTMSMMFRGESA